MRAVILERNKLVGRKVARLFQAAGLEAITLEEPSQLGTALDDADLVCAGVGTHAGRIVPQGAEHAPVQHITDRGADPRAPTTLSYQHSGALGYHAGRSAARTCRRSARRSLRRWPCSTR